MTTSPVAKVRPTGLRARQRERVRDDILEAVVRVFAADGGSGAVIEQIAAEAGLSRATLYAHFPGGVAELIHAAYERLGERFVREAEERLTTRTDWRERILTHAEVMAEWGGHEHLGTFYSIVGPRVLSARHTSGIGSRSTHLLVRTELERAQRLGEVSPSIDPASVADLLTGCVRVIGVESARDSSSSDAHLAAFRALISGLQ